MWLEKRKQPTGGQKKNKNKETSSDVKALFEESEPEN